MIAFSAVVVLVPNIDLMGVMLTAQFVNGLVLPVLLVFMAIIAADKRVMGAYRSRIVSRVLIWVTVGIVTVLTAVLLVMQVPSRRRLSSCSRSAKNARLLSPLRAQSSSICTVKLNR